MRARSARVVVAMALAGITACTRSSAPPDSGVPGVPTPRAEGVVDTHLHVAPSELGRLHALMDAQGIAWGLNLSGRWPGGPLEAQLEAARQSGRLLVATNLPWVAAARRDDFPQIAVALMTEARSLGARALKIEKALGLGAIKPDGTLLAVDDPWLDPVWKAAGELGLPVVIHVGDPKAFWLPIDEKNERYDELSVHPGWSNYGDPSIPSFDALLAALMRVVARHPKTTFVSVHFGNNAEDPVWVGRMLDEHPNLMVDLAARLPELGRHEAKALHALFVRHADRILFATDLGIMPRGGIMLGSTGAVPDTDADAPLFFAKHWRWLETWDKAIDSPTPIQGRWKLDGIGLPEEALRKIYRQNAERVFGKPEPARPAARPSPP